MFAFNILLEDVLDYRKDSKHKDFNQEIQNILNFQEHITGALEAALKEWRER